MDFNPNDSCVFEYGDNSWLIFFNPNETEEFSGSKYKWSMSFKTKLVWPISGELNSVILDVPKLKLDFSTKLSRECFTLFNVNDALTLDVKVSATINSLPLL